MQNKFLYQLSLRSRRRVSLMFLIWAAVLLLLLPSSTRELGYNVDLMAVLVLLWLAVQALRPWIQVKNYLCEDAWEIYRGGKLIRRLPYSECRAAYRQTDNKGVTTFWLTWDKLSVQCRETDWEPCTDDAAPAGDFLIAHLPPNRMETATTRAILRWFGKGMIDCFKIPQFILPFLFCFVLVFGLTWGLRAQIEDGCPFESTGSDTVYFEQESTYPISPTEEPQQLGDMTLQITHKAQVSRLDALHYNSGICMLWHRLTGTLPAWQQGHREYTAACTAHDYSLPQDRAKGYWAFTVTPAPKDSGRCLQFINQEGFSLSPFCTSVHAGSYTGYLLQQPAKVLLLLPITEE